MKNSKKSAAQHVKVFKQLSGEQGKANSDLSVKIVVNYSLPAINLFQIPTKKFGSKIG
jgi:hypothetical protein